MAVRAVDRELVSESEFPDLQGKYREFARNRLSGEAGFSSLAPSRGPTRRISLNEETGNFCRRAGNPATRTAKAARDYREVILSPNLDE